jgi:hypothetical protein
MSRLDISRRALLVGAGLVSFGVAMVPREAKAAFSLVAHAPFTPGLTSANTNANPINTTGANLLVVFVSWLNNVGQSITLTDSKSNAWTSAVDASATQDQSQIFYCLNPTVGASHTFTVTGVGNVIANGGVQAWSGAASANVLGPTNSVNLSSFTSPIQPGSVSPWIAGSLVVTGVTWFGATGAVSINDSFTISDQVDTASTYYASAMAYLIDSSPGAINPSWSGPDSYRSSAIAVFLPQGPTTQNIFVNCGIVGGNAGDISTPAPFGTISSFSWSSGVATLNTASPLPSYLTTGMTVQLAVNNFSNLSSGYCSNGGPSFNATVTGPSQLQYPVASSPTAPASGTNYWLIYGINSIIGGLNADLTNFFSGTCGSNAADNTHIVVGTGISWCVGHAILRNSDPLTYIVGYNATTGVAMVAQIGRLTSNTGTQLAASFSSTPQSGDTFTIYPMNTTVTIGAPSTGHTFWQLAVYNPGNTAVPIAARVSPGLQDLTIQGFQMHNSSVALGLPADNNSAPVIKNGDGTNVATATGVLGIGCAVKLRDLQLWQTGPNATGVFGWVSDTAYTMGAVDTERCTLRSSVFDIPADYPMVFRALQTFPSGKPKFYDCVFVVDFMADYHIINGFADCRFCTAVCVGNYVGTLASQMNNGASSFTLQTGQGANVITNGEPGVIDSTGLLRDTTNGFLARVSNVTGDVVTVSFATAQANISSGTTMEFGSADLTTTNANGFSCTNSAIFGVYQPIGNHGAYTLTSNNNMSDNNPFGVTGFTHASYTAAFNSASQQGTGSIDLRVPGTSPLVGAGAPDAAVPLDIFGNTRSLSAPTVGAVEYIAPTASGNATFFRVAP